MRWQFTFGLASDDLFFVATRRVVANSQGTPPKSKLTTFSREDDFLKLLVAADIGQQQTVQLAAAVLTSIARPKTPPAWVEADVTQHQMQSMHLYGNNEGNAASGPGESNELYLRAARSGSLPQFYDLLMQAPSAIAIVVGPEHRFTFMNRKFAELIGTKSVTTLLGKTVPETFPEVVAQKVLQKFDRAYETGVAYSEDEIAYKYHHEILGRTEERYLSTNCQPITNAFGEVAGLLLQTTDVTEVVLARAVREHREKLLYRQWAELEAIYRSASIALIVIDAKDYRVLQVNRRQAEMLGSTVSELVGQPVMQYIRNKARLGDIFRRVAAGETVHNQLFEAPGVLRHWLANYSPILAASGEVESIIAVALEISLDVGDKLNSDDGACLLTLP